MAFWKTLEVLELEMDSLILIESLAMLDNMPTILG